MEFLLINPIDLYKPSIDKKCSESSFNFFSISLIELLAAKLNLEPKIIRKIETNRFESLSGETFIKGYISLLARELGADVQPLMQVYQLQLQREQTCDFQVDSTRGISFKKKLGYALIIIVFALSVYYLSYAIQAKFTDNNVDNSLHHLELK